MTVEEVFSKLVAHMREGVNFHRDMTDAYDFLGLERLRKCHNHHMKEEMNGCRKLVHYYLRHYHRLLQVQQEQQEVIPAQWYKYSSQDVDVNTRRNALKDLMKKWIDWEKETKKIYQEMWNELTNIGEIAAANYVNKFVDDVSEELSAAQQELLEYEITNYDMVFVVGEKE